MPFLGLIWNPCHGAGLTAGADRRRSTLRPHEEAPAADCPAEIDRLAQSRMVPADGDWTGGCMVWNVPMGGKSNSPAAGCIMTRRCSCIRARHEGKMPRKAWRKRIDYAERDDGQRRFLSATVEPL
jgi:hypothetical protein